MKKLLSTLLACSLIFGIGTSLSTNAASSAKSYKNCTELNKGYKGGVAESSSAKNKGGKTKHKPHVSKEVYDANKKLDRDKDKIACEK
ncbi:excalibur calcium-binding domain-containing protein [Bacillus sp. DTU_2020_1000418_1_SI_GHA_SEK_038]|uniref:excalibur calcium-binding domain-containing protein n=1 Tax=Bacillus sp. DTU_2020_1000418_1_SI_GHA_SEK_038 TaxID=3077585 RepID=UPI0028EC5899|nr:excalibur calcium-binding domain-containing protein [Bacillus sp. DTU_2020_1000418_1_SI_GHA_SEK_038]WNS75772.1 excalibur calcium-binding domain-containing protein [Bacillus sp. DTU_2020_1000418_1_SI_GHA_SEK_038]